MPAFWPRPLEAEAWALDSSRNQRVVLSLLDVDFGAGLEVSGKRRLFPLNSNLII
jgi:hypothetical protein